MNRLIQSPQGQSTTTAAQPPPPIESTTLPAALVKEAHAALLHETFHNSGVLKDRMHALQIQPRTFSFAEPEVAVIATDPKCHTCPECLLNTLMITAAHSAALDLHNLACTVEPVTPFLNGGERFGVAFFAETQAQAGAALRLRDTLDIVAAEIGARSRCYINQRPQIEFIHQMMNPFPSPTRAKEGIPVEVFRIRYRGLDWAQMGGLLADALRSLPPLSEKAGRRDLFTMTLSGED